MPDYKYNNQATSQAIASISAGATSVILETGKGALFPSTYPFQVLLQQYNSSGVVTAQEIASCTNRSSDTLTITRANEAIPNTPSSTTQAQVARSFDISIGIIQVTNVTTAAVFTEVVNSVKKTGPENIDGVKTFRDNMVLETADISLTEAYQILWQLAGVQRASIFGDSLSNLIFRTGSTPTERMRLRSTGALITGILETTGNVVFKANATIGDETPTTGLFLNIWKPNSTTNQIDSYTHGVGFRDLIINGNQLFLKSNGNVGIGTVDPTAKLEVAGQVKITGGNPGNGKILTSDANGNATWQGAIGAKAYTSSFSSTLTLTTVPFGNEAFNTNAFHNNVTNNSRLTIPAGMGGVYQIIANGKVNGATVYTQTGVELWKNGALFTIGVANYNQWRAGLSFSEIDNCSAGDYFELKIQTDPNRTWDYISLSLIKL